MANFFDILKNVCILAHEDEPASFGDLNGPYPEIKQYIKDTLEEVCSKFPWTFRERKYSFNTVQGQKEYALQAGLVPSNILEDGVRIVGYNDPLYFVYHNDLDKIALSNGRPYRYSIFSSRLILDPVPDNIYNVEIKFLTANYVVCSDGLTEKANFELETDASIIPDRFAKVIEWGALALYRQNFRPDEKYTLAQNKFLNYLQDMTKQNDYSKDAKPSIIISTSCDNNEKLIRDFFNPGI